MVESLCRQPHHGIARVHCCAERPERPSTSSTVCSQHPARQQWRTPRTQYPRKSCIKGTVAGTRQRDPRLHARWNRVHGKRVALKRFRSIVGRHAARILPVAKAFFTPLYNALRGPRLRYAPNWNPFASSVWSDGTQTTRGDGLDPHEDRSMVRHHLFEVHPLAHRHTQRRSRCTLYTWRSESIS
jgi:hypothetical protein